MGDLVITPRNRRHLTSRDEATFVKNGATWTVERMCRNGDLTARATQHINGVVRLPRHYVGSHVQLGYTTTATRSPGRAVDTAHVLIDHTTTREALH